VNSDQQNLFASAPVFGEMPPVAATAGPVKTVVGRKMSGPNPRCTHMTRRHASRSLQEPISLQPDPAYKKASAIGDIRPDPGAGSEAKRVSFAGALSLTLISSLLLMTSYEWLKQIVAPDIGIWSSHLVTIVFSSLVATAAAFFALQRHERLSLRIAQESSLRRQAEEALLLLSQKSVELELSKSNLEREIAGRIEARQETAAASSLLSATIESTVDGIMAVDPHGEISACNRRFAEMWGIADEVLACGDSNTVLLSVLGQVRDSAKFFQQVTELYWQPEQESYDLVELTDGRCFERISKPQRNGEKVVGRVWTFHDVTELKRLESQLLHAQKMEAVGTLAGGIAHDFNNIMTAIIGYTSLLLTELDPPAPFRGFLEKIDESSNRAVALIQNLLAYSRKQCVQASVLECNSLVRNIVGFLERLIGADIDLVMKLSGKPQHVFADAGQLEQVLVNLSTNARDAMPDGGRLTLEVSSLELSDEFVKPFSSSEGGPYVRITVSDTGSGVDEATRQRIFEPFFTTKEVGKGTGLGLSISYGIAKQHGGFLSVDSTLGLGTTFSLYLPQVAPVRVKRAAALPVTTVPRGDETVLLVEDNDSVRSLISHILTAQGYRVIEAVDGADGVDKFRAHQEEIALAILDVIMPKKNGGDACDEMRAIRGDLRTIFISGYSGDVIDRQRILEDGGNFLQKPILPQKLLGLVRDLLDRE
jgi:two-component system cell cycle sensor histidine kinase/response regulator CckA